MNRVISIVTDWSPSLGSGHIQRMMNLADIINSDNRYKCFIVSRHNSIEGYPEFSSILLNQVHPDTFLIIRDMRDSSIDQITELKSRAPVLAIDDLGPGAEIADYKICLLPDPTTRMHDLHRFLYGYNFSRSIKTIKQKTQFEKDIDISFYTGYKPDIKYVESVTDLFPANATAAVLSGENSFLLKNGLKQELNIEYSETLLKAKITVAHFGLTIYEGFACKSIPHTINPTEYHNLLTGIVTKEMGIIDLGIMDKLDKKSAAEIIKKSISVHMDPVSREYALEKISAASDGFYKYLTDIAEKIL